MIPSLEISKTFLKEIRLQNYDKKIYLEIIVSIPVKGNLSTEC